jgi:hypothetical protein
MGSIYNKNKETKVDLKYKKTKISKRHKIIMNKIMRSYSPTSIFHLLRIVSAAKLSFPPRIQEDS